MIRLLLALALIFAGYGLGRSRPLWRVRRNTEQALMGYGPRSAVGWPEVTCFSVFHPFQAVRLFWAARKGEDPPGTLEVGLNPDFFTTD